MNERAAKAARRAARAQGYLIPYPNARRVGSPSSRGLAGGPRPAWKLPRAIAAAHASLNHRERGRRAAVWARI